MTAASVSVVLKLTFMNNIQERNSQTPRHERMNEQNNTMDISKERVKDTHE